jgi:hypothetical protein
MNFKDQVQKMFHMLGTERKVYTALLMPFLFFISFYAIVIAAFSLPAVFRGSPDCYCW